MDSSHLAKEYQNFPEPKAWSSRMWVFHSCSWEQEKFCYLSPSYRQLVQVPWSLLVITRGHKQRQRSSDLTLESTRIGELLPVKVLLGNNQRSWSSTLVQFCNFNSVHWLCVNLALPSPVFPLAREDTVANVTEFYASFNWLDHRPPSLSIITRKIMCKWYCEVPEVFK